MLCINTAHLATTSYSYKSEDFLTIELLKRGKLKIPIWNFDFENLPTCSILLDDACYSGSQLKNKTLALKDLPDNNFHVVVAYASNNCVERFEKLQARNVTLHVGEIIPTAGEVAGEVTRNPLDWLTPTTFKYENRALKQRSYQPLNLCLCTPDYKIVDEKSTFTGYFAELTQTKSIQPEHYKEWDKKL